MQTDNKIHSDILIYTDILRLVLANKYRCQDVWDRDEAERTERAIEFLLNKLAAEPEVHTSIEAGYIRELDNTVIFEDTYVLDKNGCPDVISREVVGFYFGEPDDESTERFIGKTIARFIDCDEA